MRKKSNGENVKKSENVRKIECVIDDEDMWRFKFEHLEKNLEDGKYNYKDIVSRSDNTEILTANFEVAYAYEIIGLFGCWWGGWNCTPNTAVMQEMAKKWHEKYDAELIRISHDTLSFQCRKLSESEAESLMQEIYSLSAEIVDCGSEELPGYLMENQTFTLWWD